MNNRNRTSPFGFAHAEYHNLSALKAPDGIQRFLDAWNQTPRPFKWVKTAEQILAKAKPKLPRASHQSGRRVAAFSKCGRACAGPVRASSVQPRLK